MQKSYTRESVREEAQSKNLFLIVYKNKVFNITEYLEKN